MPATEATPGAVVATLGAGTNIIGKVYITDGTESANVNASNQLEVSVENTVTVSATDLDIRNLTAANDTVMIGDGAETVHINASNQMEVSVENTVTVSATDLDIRNLTAANDTVMIGDGAETAHVTASNELNVLETNSADIETAVQSVATAVYLEDSGHTTADPGIQMLSVRKDTAASLVGDDLDYTPLIVDSTGRLHVTLSDTITVSATNLDIRNLAPATDSVKVNDGTTDLAVAVEDSAAKTAGLQAMGRYDATIPTAVADGDATLLLTDCYGVLQTTGHVGGAWRAAQNQSSAQTNTALQAAPAGSLCLYVTDIIISNGATAGNVKLVESTASSPVDILEVMYFAINGGCVINLQTPLKLTANKDLGYTSVSCTTHSVTVAGYTAL